MSEEKKRNVFKYNMSFYYQSTIIYFVVFILYILIRGEFIEGSFILITEDPIIYFFGIIVLISLISLLYNIYKKKYLEVNSDGISFSNRFKVKHFSKEQISFIKFSKGKELSKRNFVRFIKLKLKGRKRKIIIRPNDYENEDELIERFQELKSSLEEKKIN